jgi:hypothetical protein
MAYRVSLAPPLPQLPDGDRWMSTLDVAMKIFSFRPEELVDPKALKRAKDRVYRYRSSGLPLRCPLPEPDARPHGRCYWRESKIIEWHNEYVRLSLSITLPD